MNRVYRSIFLGIAGLVAGCMTTPSTNPQQLEQLKTQNQARIVAPSSSFFSFLAIGTEFDMGISQVDGKDVGGKDEMNLPSGEHQLVAYCSYAMTAEDHEGGPVTKTTLHMDLEAGHVYQLKPTGEGYGPHTCGSEIIDVTDAIRANKLK